MLEGLGLSARPCARGLSVAGLLAIMRRFLPGEGFILRVKKPFFLFQDPRIFNNGDKTVIGSRHIVVQYERYMGGCTGRLCTAYIGGRGGIYGVVVYPAYTREEHYAPHSLLFSQRMALRRASLCLSPS